MATGQLLGSQVEARSRKNVCPMEGAIEGFEQGGTQSICTPEISLSTVWRRGLRGWDHREGEQLKAYFKSRNR